MLIKKGAANLEADSLALAYQLRTISKKWLGKLIGSISDQEKQNEIEKVVKLHLDL